MKSPQQRSQFISWRTHERAERVCASWIDGGGDGVRDGLAGDRGGAAAEHLVYPGQDREGRRETAVRGELRDVGQADGRLAEERDARALRRASRELQRRARA